MAIPAFRGRALVATLMLCGFIALITSGVVLYASPSGRVARDLGWIFLSLDKWAWRDFHIAFGLLFLLTAFFHLWLNIKPLINYVRQKLAAQANGGISFRWRLEPMIAVTLCVLLGVSAVKGFPPVSYVIDIRDSIMEHWDSSASDER